MSIEFILEKANSIELLIIVDANTKLIFYLK
jgi:hypothetical protein